MKTKKYFWILMMVLAAFVISCDTDEDPIEACEGEDLAEDFNCPIDVDAIATFCADGVNDSYYTYAGTDYYCTGVEASTCDYAINQVGIALIAAGCGSKKTGNIDAGLIKLSGMAENLLAEVRTESLCN